MREQREEIFRTVWSILECFAIRKRIYLVRNRSSIIFSGLREGECWNILECSRKELNLLNI
jgi:hypothetical protein